jgi:antitoxin component YwqK of YwqJK toxin-antitoxin module
MKNFNIFFSCIFLIIFIPNLTYSQEDLNQQDDSGKKFGAWEGRYPNGNLRYKGRFHDNQPVGTFQYFYEDGSKRATNEFSKSGHKAINKSFSKSGILIAEGIYLDQKKDSVWRIYSDADGVLLSEETYKNDHLEGVTIVYYPGTSQKAEETYYIGGIKNGTSKKFFENGQMMSVTNFRDDQPEGMFTFFYESGLVQLEGNYKNGFKFGKWVSYDEQGNLLSEEEYKEQK